jgi:hypothetical protein
VELEIPIITCDTWHNNESINDQKIEIVLQKACILLVDYGGYTTCRNRAGTYLVLSQSIVPYAFYQRNSENSMIPLMKVPFLPQSLYWQKLDFWLKTADLKWQVQEMASVDSKH